MARKQIAAALLPLNREKMLNNNKRGEVGRMETDARDGNGISNDTRDSHG